MNARVAVFAPSPQLTITVEELDGEPDVHLHPGGQGVWQARMICVLGGHPVLCAAFGGESGHVVRGLIARAGIETKCRDVAARNGVYLHDRHRGERLELVEQPADALSRHELDDLYGMTLAEAMRAGIALLSGPAQDRVLPHETYRRLCADLRENDCRVIVDLAGDRLHAALEGGPYVVKVSHEELGETDLGKLTAKCREIASHGPLAVVVSRADEPALALIEERLFLVRVPVLAAVDPKGAGDSMTAGIATGLATEKSLAESVRLGAAAGAVNVTRHGLGSGDGEAIRELANRVELEPIEE